MALTTTSYRQCGTSSCDVILDDNHPYAICNKCWKRKNDSTYNNVATSANNKEFNHFGELEQKKKCLNCDTDLSIYNPYDLCNSCRRKELDKEVLKHRGVKDTVYHFNKDHRRKPVKKYSTDLYSIDYFDVEY